jgi:hypothetical protein
MSEALIRFLLDKMAAAAWLAARVGHGRVEDILRMQELYRSLYRTAAGRMHPDRGEASRDDWDRLQAAKKLLDQHHGVR